MTHKTFLPDGVYDYLVKHTVTPHPVLTDLRAFTASLPGAGMQIAEDQGQLFSVLLPLIGAQKVIELGTFTGYSALAMALALPETGTLITCDVDARSTEIAQSFFKQAGVEHKIRVVLQPALNTLSELIEQGHENSFDFCFIDADKQHYPTYYEQCLKLCRPNGLIAIDNMLWKGAVADAGDQSKQVRAIRQLTQIIQEDDRTDHALLSIADGLMLVRKKH